MDNFKVCTAKHASKLVRTEDKDYDTVKFFEDIDSARSYYLDVFDDNYIASLFERKDGKWDCIASSCRSSLAQPSASHNPNITMSNTSDEASEAEAETETENETEINAEDVAKLQNQMQFITALEDCFASPENRELDAFDKIDVRDGANANKLILDIFYAGFIVTMGLINRDDMDAYDYINLINRLLAQKQVDESSEYRTPKEPYWRTEKDEDGYVHAEGWACPRCDMGVTAYHGKIRDTFCSSCGQALNWDRFPQNYGECDDLKKN